MVFKEMKHISYVISLLVSFYHQGNVLGMVQDIADCLVWAQENGEKFNFDKVCLCFISIFWKRQCFMIRPLKIIYSGSVLCLGSWDA